MLNEYVTTTITNVMSAFFGSQFSEQSTAVKVTLVAVNDVDHIIFSVLFHSVHYAVTDVASVGQ